MLIESLEDRNLLAADFGDAPAPYPVTLADDGARHEAVGPMLGSTRDMEATGTPSANALGDGPDEDGLLFGVLRPGQRDATVIVNVQNAPSGAILDGWIDFNQDGNWGGSEDRVFAGQFVAEGNSVLKFDVPSWTPSETLVGRFRLSSTGVSSVAGAAIDGEVEDILIPVQSPVPSTFQFSSPELLLSSGNILIRSIDLDQDGDMDFFGRSLSNRGFWAEQTETGSFVKHDLGYDVVDAADIDLDGDIDFLAMGLASGTSSADESLGLLINQGDQNFTFEYLGLTVSGGRFSDYDGNGEGRIADMDGDGDLDFLMAVRPDSGPNRIHLVEQTGTGWTQHIVSTSAGLLQYDLHAADLDRDGDLDFAFSTYDGPSQGRVGWYRNDGNWNFVEEAWTTGFGQATNAIPLDYDADGDLDVLAAGPSDLGDEIELFRNDGAASFTQIIPQTEITPHTYGVNTVFPADLSGDGQFDIVWGDWWGRTVGWIPHTTTSPFSVQKLHTFGTAGNFLWADDVQDDGVLDILVSNRHANGSQGSVYWIANEGLVTLDNIDDTSMQESLEVALTGIGSNRTGGSPLRITATSSHHDLIATPSVQYDSSGSTAILSLSRTGSQAGVSLITVTVEDGGLDGVLNTTQDNVTFSRDFAVALDAKQNSIPTIDANADFLIPANASEQVVELTGITAGVGESQPLRVTATSDNPELIPNPTVAHTSPGATGSLSLTPVSGNTGTATITVTVEDGGLDGDLATTSDNATVDQQFVVTVATPNFVEVNDRLEIRLLDDNQTVQTQALSNGYQLKLQNGIWIGNDSANVVGHGTTKLTVTSAGRDFFDALQVDDYASGGAVEFLDSGTHTYSDSWLIDLDDPSAGGISFVGKTQLVGAASLEALTTHKIMVSGTSTVVSTVDGQLKLWSNQQTDIRSDVTQAISIIDAAVEVTGSGNLDIRGRSGGSSSHDSGFLFGLIVNRGLVSGGVEGSLTTIKGRGGNSTGNFNHGILIDRVSHEGVRGTITSSGGNVDVEGIAGGAEDSILNVGLFVGNGGLLSAGLNGSIEAYGRGGNSSGDQNYGVWVGRESEGYRATIASSGGDVSVSGHGGGIDSSLFNDGVRLWDRGLITSGGTGAVHVNGLGGLSQAGQSNGVGVFDRSSIESSGGNITVSGIGGSFSTSASALNRGVELRTGGKIIAGGAGEVTVTGTGGSSHGGYNYGVIVAGIGSDGSRSTITSSGGDVRVVGQGGESDTTESFHNQGVNVSDGGLISASDSGTVSVSGVGGLGNGNYKTLTGTNANHHHGVSVLGVSAGGVRSSITSAGGDVSVIGIGGGLGDAGFVVGVHVAVGGLVTAGGLGVVSIQGTGGSGSGDEHYGVWVGASASGHRAAITSSGGDVVITGQGGGVDGARFNDGVRLWDRGLITAGVSGAVTITGQGGFTPGGRSNGVGVFDRGTIESSGGSITVSGTGGSLANSASALNRGVELRTGGKIIAGGAGEVTVTGTGGSSHGGYNYGVIVAGIGSDGSRSTITSSGGDVRVVGQGGGSGESPWNFGLFVNSHGLISSSGSGALTVTGTSGETSGGNQIGVAVNGKYGPGQITSVDGAVTVVGHSLGNGVSAGSEGVELYTGGEISSTGEGVVNVEGAGAFGSGNGNHGVLLYGVADSGQPSRILSGTGSVMVSGTGGGRADTSSRFNHGVRLSFGGLIEGSMSAPLTVSGTGGEGSGGYHYGVLLNRESGTGQRPRITSRGGDVTVVGQGGGSGESPWNFGLFVNSHGLISSSGSGAVTVTGTSGETSGVNQIGVAVNGKFGPGQITSVDGAVNVIGRSLGNDVSSNSEGVELYTGGEISSTGEGEVNVQGSGASGSGNGNHGVLLYGVADSGQPSRILTGTGAVTVTGTGGGRAGTSSAFSNGVKLTFGALIEGPELAPLVVRGIGSASSGGNNTGVLVTGTIGSVRSTIGSRGGDVLIDGAALQTSGLSHGIAVQSSGRLDSGGDLTLLGDENNDPLSRGLFVGDSDTEIRADHKILIDATIGVDQVTTDFSAAEIDWQNGTWLAKIEGLNAEMDYDQIDVEGTVELGTLVLSGDYQFPTGGSVILIENDGTDPIVGTLPGLNEGDYLTFNQVTLHVSYVGGDGNDLELTAVNLSPELDAIAELSIAEDASAQTVNLTGIAAGGNESQPLRVTATSSEPALIPDPAVTYSSPNATGSLSFAPVADQYGTATITVTVEDGGLDGDLTTSDDNKTLSRSFEVVVNPVNDAPTMDALGNLTIEEDANAQTVPLDGITAGGGETQPLQVTATSSDPTLISDPMVTYTSANVTGSLSLTPVADQHGTVTITVTVEDGGLDGDLQTPEDNAFLEQVFTVTVLNTVDLSGQVFDDRDNDGVLDAGDGDVGLEGQQIVLLNQSDQAVGSTLTDANGDYEFDFGALGLPPGTYQVQQVEQPFGFLDGKESIGDLADANSTDDGSVDTSQDSNSITGIVITAAGTQSDAGGYNFAELLPASLQGLIWEDFDNDGTPDLTELAIDNATVTVSGVDDRGTPVNLMQTTDAEGIYEFADLRPGAYSIQETQPTSMAGQMTSFLDGQESLGELNYVPPGVVRGDRGQLGANDEFVEIDLVAGVSGLNYNFGERLDGGTFPSGGVTATIGFWQNKNGQALIHQLNGTPHSTLLGEYLTGTFPNLYGGDVLDRNGDTIVDNREVAESFKLLFKRNRNQSPAGPPKLDAQVMAVALATYVTRESMVSVDYVTQTDSASLTVVVESYGFDVTTGGVGSTSVNVGDAGEALGYANDGEIQIIDLLLATNARSIDGLLFDDVDGDGQGDGEIDSTEELYRTLANDLFSAINQTGHI